MCAHRGTRSYSNLYTKQWIHACVSTCASIFFKFSSTPSCPYMFDVHHTHVHKKMHAYTDRPAYIHGKSVAKAKSMIDMCVCINAYRSACINVRLLAHTHVFVGLGLFFGYNFSTYIQVILRIHSCIYLVVVYIFSYLHTSTREQM